MKLVYKCRHCGEEFIFDMGETKDKTVELAVKVGETPDEFVMVTVHKCHSGYLGVADLIGVVKIKKDQSMSSDS